MTVAGIYVGLGVLALLWHLYSVTTNPADTGLSALYLYFLAKPWIDLPGEAIVNSGWWGVLVYPLAMLFVLINSFILYILFGGLKITRNKPS